MKPKMSPGITSSDTLARQRASTRNAFHILHRQHGAPCSVKCSYPPSVPITFFFLLYLCYNRWNKDAIDFYWLKINEPIASDYDRNRILVSELQNKKSFGGTLSDWNLS